MTDKKITIRGSNITVSKKGEKAVWMVYNQCTDVIAHGTTEPLKLVETTEKSERIYEVDDIQIIIEKYMG